ncbi:MAG: LacI family DNA-binding transcriptional regulator [Victivallales bacterium]|nr:LacI family DNA-binding transcriptional regulator [Victivallales bacterium]
MRTTLKDIAKHVNVSKSLVSMYLNNHALSAKIADSTKKRIDEAVKELNYRPSYTAKALSNGKTKTIGLICGGITNPYFSHLIEEALNESARHGYQLIISITRWIQEEEEACFDSLIQRQIDGIINCLHLRSESPLYSMLKKSKIPVCGMNTINTDFAAYNIKLDNAMDEAVNCLAQRGHKRILGFFYHESEWASTFISACEKFGIIAEPQYTLPKYPLDISVSIDEILQKKPSAIIMNGYEIITEFSRILLENDSTYRPEIIIGNDDFMKIPQNQYITGCIHSNMHELTRSAVGYLIESIENPQKDKHVVEYFPAIFIKKA